MYAKFSAGMTKFGCGDQSARRHAHRMQFAFDVAAPEIEKAMENGKTGSQIEFLPDVALQNRWVIRHVIENFGRGQPIPTQL